MTSDRPAPSPPGPALPFWLSLSLLPLVVAGLIWGGWVLIALPVYGWVGITVLDALAGRDGANPDPATPPERLRWHRLVTRIWLPLQLLTIFGSIWAVGAGTQLAGWEKVALFAGIGVVSGAIGITYAHELVHESSRLARWLGDLLLASVLYGHFRSEHLLVHHRHVATPADAVTARRGEGFGPYLARVLIHCPRSAFAAEAALLARRGRAWWHPANPFWRYGALQGGMLALAFGLGGAEGVGLFVVQAAVAVLQLELTNYIEHYGLTREHLGGGRYEPVRPHHSWNAEHRVSNWLLINLQRHADHHTRPDRPFALLQTYPEAEAPQLPFGYPVMTAMALVPPLWRRVMDPRVAAWRRRHYPHITDWSAYDRMATPAG